MDQQAELKKALLKDQEKKYEEQNRAANDKRDHKRAKDELIASGLPEAYSLFLDDLRRKGIPDVNNNDGLADMFEYASYFLQDCADRNKKKIAAALNQKNQGKQQFKE